MEVLWCACVVLWSIMLQCSMFDFILDYIVLVMFSHFDHNDCTDMLFWLFDATGKQLVAEVAKDKFKSFEKVESLKTFLHEESCLLKRVCQFRRS